MSAWEAVAWWVYAVGAVVLAAAMLINIRPPWRVGRIVGAVAFAAISASLWPVVVAGMIGDAVAHYMRDNDDRNEH